MTRRLLLFFCFFSLIVGSVCAQSALDFVKKAYKYKVDTTNLKVSQDKNFLQFGETQIGIWPLPNGDKALFCIRKESMSMSYNVAGMIQMHMPGEDDVMTYIYSSKDDSYYCWWDTPFFLLENYSTEFMPEPNYDSLYKVDTKNRKKWHKNIKKTSFLYGYVIDADKKSLSFNYCSVISFNNKRIDVERCNRYICEWRHDRFVIVSCKEHISKRR